MKQFLVMIFVAVSIVVRAQQPDSIRLIVERAGTDFMRSPGAVGMAIGIYLSGKTYTYYYGVTDVEKKSKTSQKTIFNIASLSKTFTGLLLAKAHGEHKLSMQDDVRKYLDGSYPNLEYSGHPIRLIHLVSHVSRLPFHLSDRADKEGYSRDDFFADLHRVQIDTLPGVKFKYSNAAVQLLGIVLEKVYGQTYEDLLAMKIDKPLGLKHTGITPTRSDVASIAKGYDEKGINDPRSYDYLQGAGGVRSTVDDLLKYVELQINEGDEATRLTHGEVWGFDMGNGNYYSFGLGWQIVKTQNGKRRISQDGNLPSSSSVIIFCPELRTGIVVLTNSFMMDKVGEVANTILKGVQPDMP